MLGLCIGTALCCFFCVVGTMVMVMSVSLRDRLRQLMDGLSRTVSSVIEMLIPRGQCGSVITSPGVALEMALLK